MKLDLYNQLDYIYFLKKLEKSKILKLNITLIRFYVRRSNVTNVTLVHIMVQMLNDSTSS